MKTIPISIEAITPVHIGNGNKLNGGIEFVFFQKDRKIVVLHPEKVYNIIGEENLHIWMAKINNNEDILDYLVNRKPDIKPKDIAERIMDIDTNFYSLKNSINEQIQLGIKKRPSIPGSSLKGAIRTAVLNHLIEETEEGRNYVSTVDNLKTNKRYFKDQKIVAKLLGGKINKHRELAPYPNEDLLRLLQVSDALFSETRIEKSAIINLHNDRWRIKKDANTFMECIPEGAITNSAISFNETLSREINRFLKSKPNEPRKPIVKHCKILQLKSLFKIINTQTLKLLNGEIDLLENELFPSGYQDYISILEDIENTILNIRDNQCVLRVGNSVGWEAINGGWYNNLMSSTTWNELKGKLRNGKYGKLTFPKTRKLLSNGQPMGFVLLEFND